MKTLIALLCLFGASSALTQAEYDIVWSQLETYFLSNATFVPTAVRLAFHDCVGTSCDGCINLDNDSNNGLAEAITFFAGMRDDILAQNISISTADYWAIASIAAIERGIFVANKDCPRGKNTDPYCLVAPLDMTFQWGRQDCATSPTTATNYTFPNPLMSSSEMFDYFNNMFGFDTAQTVALMGAHTLGSCKRNNSGYLGNWIQDQAREFDNEYYKYLLTSEISWANEDVEKRPADRVPDRKWQFNGNWTANDTFAGMMLNTDFGLLYDLELNTQGEAGCAVHTNCGYALGTDATSILIQEFANDVEAWKDSFKDVFSLMLAHGNQLSDLA